MVSSHIVHHSFIAIRMWNDNNKTSEDNALATIAGLILLFEVQVPLPSTSANEQFSSTSFDLPLPTKPHLQVLLIPS